MSTPLYHIGDQPTITTTLTNRDGEPTSPTTFEAWVERPDGTETAVTPTDQGDGVLVTNLPVLDAPGVWRWRVAGTAGVIAADEGSFRVRPTVFTDAP